MKRLLMRSVENLLLKIRFLNGLVNKRAILKNRFLLFFLLIGLSFGLITCSAATSLEPIALGNSSTPGNPVEEETDIHIIWTQGFLPEENEAIATLVSNWEQQSGLKADLTLMSQRDIIQETTQAVEAGNPPDVLFAIAGDTDFIPEMAWRGKLADVSQIIEGTKDTYTASAVEAVSYQNNVIKERHYYAVPLAQQTTNIHYWKSWLEQAGLRESDIPSNWDGFWQFWKQAQDRLRQQGNADVFALGLCMSDRGQDTNLVFAQFLEAYGVEVVDKSGKLRIGEPENRNKIIRALTQLTGFYTEGYIPQDAKRWSDADNNIDFLERQSILTANGTLSIPLAHKQAVNPYNRISNELYTNDIRTLLKWPANPDGSPHRSIIGIKQVVAFQDSQHREAADNFLAYLTEPAVVNGWLSQQKGRFFPVMPQLLKSSPWNDPTDPHISQGLKLVEDNVKPDYQVYSPAYSKLLSQKVWAKAVLNVLDGTSPEQAVDAAIDDAEKIFAEFR